VTDENGCATDPSVFGEWELDPDTNLLMAQFNAFKFPSGSNSIKFNCAVRICFGKCQSVNCRGVDAFGRRRKRQVPADTSPAEYGFQMREEVNITSNEIITLEELPNQSPDAITEARQISADSEVCISRTGIIISLILTALLSLLAIAIAISCWLLAFRRQAKATGPLPHPAEFPNPLFTENGGGGRSGAESRPSSSPQSRADGTTK